MESKDDRFSGDTITREELLSLSVELPSTVKNEYIILINSVACNTPQYAETLSKAIQFELAYHTIKNKPVSEISKNDIEKLKDNLLGEENKQCFTTILSEFSLEVLFSENEDLTRLWKRMINSKRVMFIHRNAAGIELDNLNALLVSLKTHCSNSNSGQTKDVINSEIESRSYDDVPQYSPPSSRGEHFLWSGLKAVFWGGVGALVGLILFKVLIAVGVVGLPAGLLVVGWFAGTGFALSSFKSALTNTLDHASWAKSFTFWCGAGAGLGAVIGGIAGTFIPIPGIGTSIGALIGAAVGGFVAGVTQAIVESIVDCVDPLPGPKLYKPTLEQVYGKSKNPMSKLNKRSNVTMTEISAEDTNGTSKFLFEKSEVVSDLTVGDVHEFNNTSTL